MEVKINREIRDYKESMFFGLTMRQVLFSAIGIVAAIVVYFALNSHCNIELISWACMFSAAPFVAMGFITYNGMTAEEFAVTWIRSKLIEPKKVKFECDTIYNRIEKKTGKEKRND